MVFIDTSAIVALFDKADKHHLKAKKMLEIIRNNRIRLLMSDYILDERASCKSICEIRPIFLSKAIFKFLRFVQLKIAA